ncbi:RNA polymerase sigma factor [Paenibacillus spongiae]|uniref:RNA polymerase sigma factor n=1 Tax=Paenibacillus spongiae TaxID=2909671 RepID=A0ABY5S554_9BACL|nr:RNA polymerase sigma factor [Paenibacillus spongiae]UVI29031.1 RNA polymerase sigma factor [Paenibacillus spongiae]
MNLDEALEAVAGGDAGALKLVYEEMRSIVYALALSIVRNKPAAEDILQETFVRVYEKAGTYRAGSNPKAWIVTIARNLAYDVLRRESKSRSGEIQEVMCTAGDSIEQRLALTDALFQLEVMERQIVVMHVVAGLKHHEISTQLGIPAGTVRWKYRQSLSRLADMMGGDHDEEGTAHVRAKR